MDHRLRITFICVCILLLYFHGFVRVLHETAINTHQNTRQRHKRDQGDNQPRELRLDWAL